MNEERRILRIGIDGQWEATEFATSLNALDHLYTLRFGLTLESEELRELRDSYLDAPFPIIPRSLRALRWVRNAPASFFRPEGGPIRASGRLIETTSELLEPREHLMVQRIIYGSPGISDLAGIGEIVGHVKDLLMRLIEYWSTRRQRALENKHRELENRQLQIEIAQEFVGLAQQLGYTKREMRQLVASVVEEQRPIVQQIAAGKITSADIIEGEPHSHDSL